MEKKYYKVGYSYYPHESMVSDSKIVHGTHEQAEKYLIEIMIAKLPDWVKNQIDPIGSNSRTAMFIHEQIIIQL